LLIDHAALVRLIERDHVVELILVDARRTGQMCDAKWSRPCNRRQCSDVVTVSDSTLNWIKKLSRLVEECACSSPMPVRPNPSQVHGNHEIGIESDRLYDVEREGPSQLQSSQRFWKL